MFNVTVALEARGTYPTFAEAFIKFFKDIKAMLDKGTSYQVLETACWIEMETTENDGPMRMIMNFYDARDLAYDLGLLVGNGQLVEPAPEIAPDRVSAAFRRNTLAQASALVDEIGNRASELLRTATKIAVSPRPSSPGN